MAGSSDFDFESFKKELLKEIRDETRQIVRDMMAKMVGKMPFDEEETKTRTVLGEPLKEKLKASADPTESEWMKDMKIQMDPLQTVMKNYGLNPDFANVDLDLEVEELLHSKYKFPSIKKYYGIDDLHLHLKQYVTYMKATRLSKAQIIKQFLLYLEGAAIKWYYTLDAHIQQDWKELCSTFIKQYGLNSQFEVSLQELQNTM